MEPHRDHRAPPTLARKTFNAVSLDPLTSLQQRVVKTGGRLVRHARYYWLFLAESHLTRRLFGSMLQRIWALPRADGLTQDPQAEGIWRSNDARADRCLGDALKWRGAPLTSRLEVSPWADFEGGRNATKWFLSTSPDVESR
jgi:hypothetical protein